MSLWSDFKGFAIKGNAIDLAVGVVIGAAFGGIITSIVNGIINPLIALVLPGEISSLDGRSWKVNIASHHTEFLYGHVLGQVLQFFIVAFVLFLIISKFVKGAEKRFTKPPAATTKDCPFCLETIPLKATRCKFCTSEQPEAQVKKKAEPPKADPKEAT